MTKSIAPSSRTHLSAALLRFSGCEMRGQRRGGGISRPAHTSRTSQPPMPRTFAPGLAVAMSLAVVSVFSTLRPMMQAFAPRWTIALVWALQMVPAPPVTKTTRSSRAGCQQWAWRGAAHSLKIPSLHTELRYSDRGTGMANEVSHGCRPISVRGGVSGEFTGRCRRDAT